MIKPNTSGMLRALGKPVQLKGLRDSDKDGVKDIMDCKPYNKNKQGIVHNIKTKYKEVKEARQQKKYAMKHIRKKAKAEYYRKREVEEIKLAGERAHIEAERKRKYIKGGGFLGQVGRMASKIPKAPPRKATPLKKPKKMPSITDFKFEY